MELWYDAVEAARGSMKKRFRILVTPITNKLVFCEEQIYIACCVLHSRLLDYNDADNWREMMIIVARKGDQDEYVPVSIDNDHSFLRAHYRNDPEFLFDQEIISFFRCIERLRR
jgi:hypothetical protein